MERLRKISPYLLAFILSFAGLAHFFKPDFFHALMPLWFPLPAEMVTATGILELVLAGMLLIPSSRRIAAFCVTLLFIVYEIVHVDMVVNYERLAGTEAEIPLAAAWVRMLFQFPLIIWAAWIGKQIS